MLIATLLVTDGQCQAWMHATRLTATNPSVFLTGVLAQHRTQYSNISPRFGGGGPRWPQRASVRRDAIHARDYDYGPGKGPKGDGLLTSSLNSLSSIDSEGPWLACLGPAGGTCEDGLTELHISVVFKSQPGEHLALTGNHPLFGNWDLNQAFPLKWTPNHVWQTESAICVAPGTTLEYKYVLFKDSKEGEPNEPMWQAGKNAVIHIPSEDLGRPCRFIVEDSWDGRHNHHVDKSDEHSLPQPIPPACYECGQCLMPHLHCRTCPRLLQRAPLP